jgi:hypothetical protein
MSCPSRVAGWSDDLEERAQIVLDGLKFVTSGHFSIGDGRPIPYGASMKEIFPHSAGAGLIAQERQRQVTHEGYDPAHDDEHGRGELVQAARAYAACYLLPKFNADHAGWPWDAASFKLSDDPVVNLTKAGALIAAEIDRLLRAREGK